MSTTSFPQLVNPARKKTVHVVVFDVSGSMRKPLKLRSNVQDANRKSRALEPKRVQTVFDVICRLAEDGIASAKDQDMYAAVLCFGLHHVKTCDLLAFLEERTKILQLLDIPEVYPGYQFYGRQELPDCGSREQTAIQVISREPLVKLLARAGAPYCEDYVEKHLTPESAGRYFMVFAQPDHANDLSKIVERLPDACKSKISASRWTSQLAPAIGSGMENSVPLMGKMANDYAKKKIIKAKTNAASEAISFANNLISRDDRQARNNQSKDDHDVLALLQSIPSATPKSLSSVVQLLKRLQSALHIDNEPHTVTGAGQSSPGGSQSDVINWERLLDDIEPYLYGGTPMCEALRLVGPTFQDQKYFSKILVLISDGHATDGNPLKPAQVLKNAGGTIFACLLTDSAIEEPRRLRGVNEVARNWSSAARDMFNMASMVSCSSGAVQALRRRGWKLPQSNQCKPFIQANNPTIVDEFTTASHSLGTSSDALAEMIGQISLDDYIQKANAGAQATDQQNRAICWAHATASVVHLASCRVVGRKVPDFFQIRAHLFDEFGDNDDGQRACYCDVESVLKRHPAVNESAVVASPDQDRGEVVKAFVVLTDEGKEQDPNLLAKAMQEFCKREAAPYKYPRRIEFVDSNFLPKTISGKIRRVELRAMERKRQESTSKL